MEIVVHSTLNSTQGRVVVATDPNQTVDSLITAFCIEKGTPHRKEYVLRNKELEVLTNHKKLHVSGVQDRDILYLSIREATDEWACGCNQWWLLATVALLIGCVGLVAITIIHIQQGQILYEYGAVVDAGSSHSQVYVYKWPGGKHNGTAVPEQIYSEKIVPGISNYTADPPAAGKSLEPSLKQAESIVPKRELSNTLIYLGATAGMRLLNESDKAVSDAIMNSTRTSIAKFGFNFTLPEEQAHILDGREEGAYGWVTANYLSGVFKPVSTLSFRSAFTNLQNPVTHGALDLGGASTQITFVPEDIRAPMTSDHQTLLLYGHNYTVYTHSYMCYGVNEAFRQYQAHLVQTQSNSSIIEDPCRPRGNNATYRYDEIFDVPCTKNKSLSEDNKNGTYTFVGTSNVSRCEAAVGGIFDFNTSCDDPPCSFDGVSQPPVYGEYLAFSGFFYTMSYLNLVDKKYSLKDFEDAYETLCKKNYTTVLKMPPSDASLGSPECFMAVYVHTLLVDAYHFNSTNWNTLTFTKTLEGADLGWTLGYMLNSSYTIPVETPVQRISTVLFALLVVLFGVFLAIAVGFACHARNTKKRDADYQRMATYGSI